MKVTIEVEDGTLVTPASIFCCKRFLSDNGKSDARCHIGEDVAEYIEDTTDYALASSTPLTDSDAQPSIADGKIPQEAVDKVLEERPYWHVALWNLANTYGYDPETLGKMTPQQVVVDYLYLLENDPKLGCANDGRGHEGL